MQHFSWADPFDLEGQLTEEERMVREDSYWPFTGNIYDIWDILF